MKKYQVLVKGQVVFEADTMWDAMEYADFYHNQGYTIK